MGVWSSIRRAFGGVDSKASSGRSGLLWRLVPYGAPPRRGTRQLMQAYREHPWFRAATNKIAVSVAKVPWRLYQGIGTDRQELQQHPFLDLWKRPNPMMTARMVRQVTQIILDLKGECFWVIERDNAGRPCAIYPIPPHWMIQVPSAATPWFQGAHNLWQSRIPQEDVIWFKDPDPEDPYSRGVGIGESLSDELDTDEYAAKHSKTFFTNHGLPDSIVSIEDLGEEEAARLKEEWRANHQGFANAFRTFFTGSKINVERLDTTFKDMDLIPLRKFERDTILQTYGVPPEIMGIVEHSNRSTIDQAYAMFAQAVLVPRLDFMQEEMQQLAAMYGDDLSYEYDNPVPDDKDFAIKAMQIDPTAFTKNELRDLADYDPIDGGDVPLTPKAGLPPAGSDAGAKALPGDPPWAATLPARRKSLDTDAVQAILDALDPSLIDDVLHKLFDDEMADWVRYVLEQVGLAPADVDDVLDDSDDDIAAFLEELASTRLTEYVNGTTHDQLQDSLEQGIAAGETVEQLRQRVVETFEFAIEVRAGSIAETETVRAANWSSQYAYESTDQVISREWCSMEDEKVRAAHVELNGQSKPVAEPFEVNGKKAMFPGGFGDPELDNNCRCFLIEQTAMKAASQETREERHRQFEKRVGPWERKAKRKLQTAFRRQKTAVLAALATFEDAKALPLVPARRLLSA